MKCGNVPYARNYLLHCLFLLASPDKTLHAHVLFMCFISIPTSLDVAVRLRLPYKEPDTEWDLQIKTLPTSLEKPAGLRPFCIYTGAYGAPYKENPVQ